LRRAAPTIALASARRPLLVDSRERVLASEAAALLSST
jgi:hypothetical protein